MHIIIGLFLFVCSLVWLFFAGSGSNLERLLGSEQLVWVTGYALFLIGGFHMLPRPWLWGKVMTTTKQVLRTAWGVFSALTGLLGLVAMLASVIMIREIEAPVAAMGLIFGLALVAAAAAQLRPIWISREAQIEAQKNSSSALATAQANESNRVLRLAKQFRGRITATEVATQTNIHYKRAQQLLEEFQEDGLCEARVGQSGGVFYEFAEFVDPGHKRDILDNSPSLDNTPVSGVVFDATGLKPDEIEDAVNEHIKAVERQYNKK